MSKHGEALDGIILPQSRFYYGSFGRMFRNLPLYVPPPTKDEHFADGSVDERREVTLRQLAGLMTSVSDTNQDDNNDEIPAGYTYFGQFIAHDITFDPTSDLQRRNDPNKLRNFRTPRFDLDNLYGKGPDDSPFLYDKYNEGSLLMGRGRMPDPDNPEQYIPSDEDDLPRNEQGRAIIGDPRNDDNLILSQLLLVFIKFHNKVLKELVAKGVKEPFTEAQRIVRWHYQYVVINDFLKRIVGKDTFNKVFPPEDKNNNIRKPNLKFYDFKEQPFIPVEFSVAGFRLGHSMTRGEYTLNHTHEGTIGSRPIFSRHRELDRDRPFQDLRGDRFLPRTPELEGKVEWKKFLKLKDSDIEPQLSRKIDTRLTPQLEILPPSVIKDGIASLATRDLIRGWRLGLPSGQAIARAMGVSPLSPDDILGGVSEDIAAEDPPNVLYKYEFHKETPLWYYILKEAELTEVQKDNKTINGAHLGEVGGTIVAEVFLGLLAGDPLSYLNIYPAWTPEKEEVLDTIRAMAVKENDFQLGDIVYYATH